MITSAPHRVVSTEEVSISGYFRPHLLELGSCGAHFVGVNTKRSSSAWQGRTLEQYAHEFWRGKSAQVEERVRAAWFGRFGCVRPWPTQIPSGSLTA
jgi:hypothetical protein